jgi:hypothetical protein
MQESVGQESVTGLVQFVRRVVNGRSPAFSLTTETATP